MAAAKKVDYAAIEPGWRAGIKSVDQLAAEYTEATGVGVTAPAIRKHFRKLGVGRDLAAKVQAKAEAMVSQAMVSGKVSTSTTETEAAIIDAAATAVAGVRISHRKDIARARALVIDLLGEVETITGDRETFANLGDAMAKPDEKGVDKLNEAYHKAISMPSRISGLKSLAEALKNLVALEREAHGIGAEKEPENKQPQAMPMDEAARRLAYILSAGVALKGAKQ